MNKARCIYEGHFINCDLLIVSVIRDEVQSDLAGANLLFLELPGMPKAKLMGLK